MPRSHRVFGLFLLLGVLLATACAGGVKAGKLDPAELNRLVKEKESQDPFARSQVDVGLEAQRAGSGVIQVTLVNKTSRPLLVGPKYFAIIVPGQGKPIPTDPKARQLFPVSTVAPNDQVSGELSFPAELLTANARLVFGHPTADVQPAMTPIR